MYCTGEQTRDVRPADTAVNVELLQNDLYMLLHLTEHQPAEQFDRFIWLAGLGFQFPIAKFTWTHENCLGNITTIWRIAENKEDRKKYEDLRVTAQIRDKMSTCHTSDAEIIY